MATAGSIVVWEVELFDSGLFTPYNECTSNAIEDIYRNTPHCCIKLGRLDPQLGQYELDLSNMEQRSNQSK